MVSTTRPLVILIALCAFIKVSVSLDCHSCVSTNTNKECNRQWVTCAAGYICYTTVRRVPIYEKLYTKGCMQSGTCYGLQDLNDAGLCQQQGSVCTYCCTSDYCNAYNTGHNRHGTKTIFVLFIILYICCKWNLL